MTVEQVIATYTEASSAVKLGDKFVRNGNWEPIARTLRHFRNVEDDIIEPQESSGVETLLLVTPPPVEAPKVQRAPFYILVTQ